MDLHTARKEFFANYHQPESKEEAIKLLRKLRELGLDWHFDDSLDSVIIGATDQALFSPDEAELLSDLVPTLNLLWSGHERPSDHGMAINAGAWDAAEEAGWLDDTPMKQEGWDKGPDRPQESVQQFVDEMLDDHATE